MLGPILAGCGLFGEKEPDKACPPVFLLKDARELTRFKEGPGRDITDIQVQVRIANYKGTCNYDDEEADIELGIDFTLEPGPAAKGREFKFKYFVAIPAFHPRPEGKRVFDTTAKIEDLRRRAVLHNDLTLKIPIPRKASPSKYAIYLGLQLTPTQLEYNRARSRR